MGTFSRLRYVIAANVNALIEKAEDPEKLLRALIREMEDATEEARIASAELLAEQMHFERLSVQLTREAEQWQQRAEKAVKDQKDDLARAALKARAETMDRHQAVKQELRQLQDRLTQMENDMETLKSKMVEAKLKLKNLYIRSPGSRPERPDAKMALSPSEKRVRQAMGRFDRLQTQVENLEARVRSYEVGGPAPSAWVKGSVPTDPAVEEELQRMKERMGIADEPEQAGAVA